MGALPTDIPSLPPPSPEVQYASAITSGSIHNQKGIPCQDVAYSGVVHSGMTIHILLDGHGPNGHQIAEEACRIMDETAVRCLVDVHPRDMQARKEALQTVFDCAMDVINSRDDVAESGCTASVVLTGGGAMSVANVGDSEVFWAKGGTTPVALTRKHTVEDPNENLRVCSNGAIVQGGYISGENTSRAISVTRALGDLEMRKFGLISEPAMREELVQNGKDFVILASDGFWDAHGGIPANEAVNRVKVLFEEGGTAKNACDMLLELTKNDGELPFDDVAIMIVRNMLPV